MNRVEIIPAILPKNFSELEEKAARAAPFVSVIQVDIADGELVPSKTWPYLGGREEFARIIKEERELPEWQRVDYEVDLMVKHPERDAEEWILAGVRRIVLHLESGDMLPILRHLKERFSGSENTLSIEMGVALSPGEDVSCFDPYATYADFVQVMGISQIGFQGQAFRPEVLKDLSTLRERYSEGILSVDGGVNAETARRLAEAGANRLVSGSFLFDALDFSEAVRILKGGQL